jgi:hypothetical protein
MMIIISQKMIIIIVWLCLCKFHTQYCLLCVSCVFVDWTLFRCISTCSSGLNKRNITAPLCAFFCRLQSSQFQAAAMSV